VKQEVAATSTIDVTVSDTHATASIQEIAASIAEASQRLGVHVAVAESLTSGAVATALGAASDAAAWFSGAIVAYDSEIKFELLGVQRGSVYTERCAREMARGVRSLMRADFSAAVTGVGGPQDQDGVPAGTVYMAVASADTVMSRCKHFDGDPGAVITAGVHLVLSELDTAIRATG
jgi:nicotinamide-nucleotide amidase